ncbi:hypothetical protein LX36DRAFT_110732 [Colletotrichum falcatum]|nr:hypothetical protein LX36DRAFT_110732 [Colletotrichum falcatum]
MPPPRTQTRRSSRPLSCQHFSSWNMAALGWPVLERKRGMWLTLHARPLDVPKSLGGPEPGGQNWVLRRGCSGMLFQRWPASCFPSLCFQLFSPSFVCVYCARVVKTGERDIPIRTCLLAPPMFRLKLIIQQYNEEWSWTAIGTEHMRCRSGHTLKACRLRGNGMNGYERRPARRHVSRPWKDLEKRDAQLAGRVQLRTRAVLLERTPLKSRSVSWGLGADVGVGPAFKAITSCLGNLGNTINQNLHQSACGPRLFVPFIPCDGNAMRAVLASCQTSENQSKDVGPGGDTVEREREFRRLGETPCMPRCLHSRMFLPRKSIGTTTRYVRSRKQGTSWDGARLESQVLTLPSWSSIVYCRHPRPHPHQWQRRSMMLALYDAGLGVKTDESAVDDKEASETLLTVRVCGMASLDSGRVGALMMTLASADCVMAGRFASPRTYKVRV